MNFSFDWLADLTKVNFFDRKKQKLIFYYWHIWRAWKRKFGNLFSRAKEDFGEAISISRKKENNCWEAAKISIVRVRRKIGSCKPVKYYDFVLINDFPDLTKNKTNKTKWLSVTGSSGEFLIRRKATSWSPSSWWFPSSRGKPPTDDSATARWKGNTDSWRKLSNSSRTENTINCSCCFNC